MSDPDLSKFADKPEVCVLFCEVLRGLMVLAHSGQCGWDLRAVFLVRAYSTSKAKILRPRPIVYPIVRKFAFITSFRVSEYCKC
jgi:hypothetical protein